jgi:hypothetical protein
MLLTECKFVKVIYPDLYGNFISLERAPSHAAKSGCVKGAA